VNFESTDLRADIITAEYDLKTSIAAISDETTIHVNLK